MKKKILSTLVAATLAMSSLPMALAADGDVEIGFKVGDSTLMINGQAQTVETPYVVGEGVTLVPLRVITEAFGAEVIWEGETKSITLKYPDVEILLQIDNPTAEVNGTAQTLLSAPELTPNGVTMVPLRFISETFGAEVSYDEATGGIKVIKSKTAANDTVGIIDNTYIGDDYYGWSMENFKDATSTDRDFDGMYTDFTVDTSTGISVGIIQLDEDFDFEKRFADLKSLTQGSTLTRADKDSAAKTIILQYKSSTRYTDKRVYVTDKYIFTLTGRASTEDADMMKKVSAIMDTFQTTYRTSDIHNLSEVNGTMRKYESEAFKYSVNIPADFFELSGSDDNVGFMSNLDDDYSVVYIQLYSKDDGETARSAAEKALAKDIFITNPDILTFSEVETKTYGSTTFEIYNHKISNAFTDDEVGATAYAENGNYIYEMYISALAERSDAETMVSDILSSFSSPVLNPDEVGIILNNSDYDEDTTYTVNGDGFTLTAPMRYREILGAGLDARDIDAQLLYTRIPTQSTRNMTVNEILETFKSEDTVKMISNPSSEKIGDKSFTTMTEYIQYEDDKTAYYAKTYLYKTNDAVYVFGTYINENNYNDNTKKELENIVASLKIEK